MSNQENNLPVIYGVITNYTEFGCQAYSIDGDTGNIIDSHFCSSEGFAKSDLGFTDPILLKWDSFTDIEHSTVGFNQRRKKRYLELYPNGYTLEWVGNIHGIEGLFEKFIEANNQQEKGGQEC